ncbi:hypothetical protein FACS189475_03060 [Betaproteobacteria bacterium]|nr:hypothetical protein FACS189475_03060 [Betaproteobacteria bacterium]
MNDERPNPEKVAELLSKIYEYEFGGKEKGRYKISRSNLRRLACRKRLEDATINKITDAVFELGYIMIDLGDYFAVVKESVMLNYRPVPKSVLLRHLKEIPASTSDDED